MKETNFLKKIFLVIKVSFCVIFNVNIEVFLTQPSHCFFLHNRSRNGRILITTELEMLRSNHPELFLEKGVLKICSKFTGEHPCWSVISVKLLYNFIEITLRHGCSRVNFLYIFRTPLNDCFWMLEKSYFLISAFYIIRALQMSWLNRNYLSSKILN